MRELSRRHFLAGAGASALVSSLAGGRAGAAGFPTRLVVWFTPQEPIDKAHWLPGPGFTLQPVMRPLDPYRNKLLILGDLRVTSADADPYAGHYVIGHVLTGRLNNYYGTHKSQFYAGGISVDQHVARALGMTGVVLGVGQGASYGANRLSYTAANQPVHPRSDPRKAFDALLGRALVPADKLAEMRAKQKSVLDVVAGHLRTLSPRLPAQDRDKLQRHLEEIRALEVRLNGAGGGGATCSGTAPPVMEPYANANIPKVTRAQVDLAVQTLACDITRVVTVQVGGSGGFGTPQWPDEGINIAKTDHDIAHEYSSLRSTTAIANREALERYHYAQFAYLLQKMDSVREGIGTLLDHSLVLWVKSMSHGHAHSQMMFMLAGGAGGQLTGGRYLSFSGAPTSNLLATICNLMSVPTTTFGDPAYCTGPLSLS